MYQSALELENMNIQQALRGLDDWRPAPNAPRMLIADDDPAVLRLLADHCARLGFDVDTASNGMQAILKARRNKLDILVIDVNMPEVDGLSVCARLLEPERDFTDAIVITGSENPSTIDRCESFGAHYVRKGPDFWNDFENALAEVQEFKTSLKPAVRSRPSVLLVDDDDDVHRFLASRLEQRGLTVRCASDIQQAYRMACKEEPAVIVTDYFMPTGDAHHLLSRLRSSPATARIPVIVLTGRRLNSAVKQDLIRLIQSQDGASQIISKSENTDELFTALQKFCGFEAGSRC